MVNFPSQRARDSEPWHVHQRAIVLRKWMPRMFPKVLSFDFAPAWILGYGMYRWNYILYMDWVLLQEQVVKAHVDVVVEGNVVCAVGTISQQVVGDAFVDEYGSIQACDQENASDVCIGIVVDHQQAVVAFVHVVVEGKVMCVVDTIDVMVHDPVKDDVSNLSGILLNPNKFETLCITNVEQDVPISPPRKERIDTAGVSYLLNQLKPKGKGGGQEHQSKKGKGKKGPQESSSYDGSQANFGAM
ncbi:hypothetical protein V6N12_050294 [Hibiscus sabdariffa]|uniref:Uncharacterized protein n=1 Tax=Hibiscus sabdariffa TaxID=183260 RepID=A0ABR2GCE9_9ROSI